MENCWSPCDIVLSVVDDVVEGEARRRGREREVGEGVKDERAEKRKKMYSWTGGKQNDEKRKEGGKE